MAALEPSKTVDDADADDWLVERLMAALDDDTDDDDDDTDGELWLLLLFKMDVDDGRIAVTVANDGNGEVIWMSTDRRECRRES